MTDLRIEPLSVERYADWRALYQGYADHYAVELTEEGLATTWRWLCDTHHPLTGLIALRNQQLIGLAHVRAMPSPLRGAEIGFLDDLYVDPDARGSGAAQALIGAVEATARAHGWPLVRWITRENNYRARALYDRIATRTDWNVYELAIG
ncbi:GNAT family N-acetyltransferase [Gammaproteobacteria bacterium]|nr:GNAT family N-acetyltransferase [Gammaproteobacteria bacterium]